MDVDLLNSQGVLSVMSWQGHTAQRERKVSVGSMDQWTNGSMVQMRSRQPSRDRGWEESMDCQSKTKTKLESTTDTEAILIVEESQLIVNKCTQVRHYESYGRN